VHSKVIVNESKKESLNVFLAPNSLLTKYHSQNYFPRAKASDQTEVKETVQQALDPESANQ
jgi:hypothetical protein